MLPAVVPESLTYGGVQFLVGGLQVGKSVTQFARLSLGLFEVGVECGNGFTQIGTCCCALTAKHILQDFTDSLRTRACLLNGVSHLLHGLEDSH